MKLMPWRSKKKSDPRESSLPSLWEDGGLERLFDRFFRDPWSLDWSSGSGDPGFGAWVPPVDITETEREVLIRSEIPGVDVKDLSITVSGDILTLTGEKSESTEKKGENYHRTERRFGSFHRNIQLPATVDPDKVKAECQNGVLTITLERKEGAATKRIPVSLKD
jgi:HSP20 family protein